jgi:syntaxin 1B/2/3
MHLIPALCSQPKREPTRSSNVPRIGERPTGFPTGGENPHKGSRVIILFVTVKLMNPRLGEATSAYRQAQERREDLLKIEQSITELADMIRVMAMHVEEQGDTVHAILKTTDDIRDDTHAGCAVLRTPFLTISDANMSSMHETDASRRYALKARKRRKICLGIIVVILIIVAIVLAIYFGALKRGVAGSN